jgi:hypothetical protein
MLCGSVASCEENTVIPAKAGYVFSLAGEILGATAKLV